MRNLTSFEVDAQAGATDCDEILTGFEPRRSRHHFLLKISYLHCR
jgi:hypothetical protein